MSEYQQDHQRRVDAYHSRRQSPEWVPLVARAAARGLRPATLVEIHASAIRPPGVGSADLLYCRGELFVPIDAPEFPRGTAGGEP